MQTGTFKGVMQGIQVSVTASESSEDYPAIAQAGYEDLGLDSSSRAGAWL